MIGDLDISGVFLPTLLVLMGISAGVFTVPLQVACRQLRTTSKPPPIGRRTEPPIVVMSVGRSVLTPTAGLTTAAAGVNVYCSRTSRPP